MNINHNNKLIRKHSTAIPTKYVTLTKAHHLSEEKLKITCNFFFVDKLFSSALVPKIPFRYRKPFFLYHMIKQTTYPVYLTEYA